MPTPEAGLFARTDEEAAARYERWRSHDPFLGIKPALLNSADLQDYVAATGMIHPFNPSESFVKPASYGIPLAGEVLFWEEQFDAASGTMRSTERSRELRRGQHLRLHRNSIVYVTLESTLRLPDYIAARFNLAIAEIYRGLLVGTGPLVDPGFTGRLHLPLHNYTANDYDVIAGDPFVWMEFTKLSRNVRWHRPVQAAPKRSGTYRRFPERKRERVAIKDYLKDDQPVTSSIPRLVGEARESAESAANAARSGRNFSIGAGIAVFAGIAAMLVTVWLGNQEADRERDQLRRELSTLEQAVSRSSGSQNSASSASPAPTPTRTSVPTASPTP